MITLLFTGPVGLGSDEGVGVLGEGVGGGDDGLHDILGNATCVLGVTAGFFHKEVEGALPAGRRQALALRRVALNQKAG